MDDFGPQEWLSALRQLESALGPSFECELARRLRALAAAPTPPDPAERLLAALETMDAYVAEQEARASAATACAPGCPFCCHTHRLALGGAPTGGSATCWRRPGGGLRPDAGSWGNVFACRPSRRARHPA